MIFLKRKYAKPSFQEFRYSFPIKVVKAALNAKENFWSNGLYLSKYFFLRWIYRLEIFQETFWAPNKKEGKFVTKQKNHSCYLFGAYLKASIVRRSPDPRDSKSKRGRYYWHDKLTASRLLLAPARLACV